jgi:hypothetical protein
MMARVTVVHSAPISTGACSCSINRNSKYRDDGEASDDYAHSTPSRSFLHVKPIATAAGQRS